MDGLLKETTKFLYQNRLDKQQMKQAAKETVRTTTTKNIIS